MKKSEKKSKPLKQSKKIKGKGDVYYSIDTGKLKEAPKGSIRVMSKEEQMKIFPRGKVYMQEMYYDEFGGLKTAPKGSARVMSRAEQLSMFPTGIMIIPNEYGQKSLQKFVKIRDEKEKVSIKRVPEKSKVVTKSQLPLKSK